MSQEWYLRKDGETFGPYPKSQLIALAKSGRLSPSTRVRNSRDGQWQRASDIPGLFRPPESPRRPEAAVVPAGTATASQASGTPNRLYLIVGAVAAALLATAGLTAWIVASALAPADSAVATAPTTDAPVAKSTGDTGSSEDATELVPETVPAAVPIPEEPATEVAAESLPKSESAGEPDPQQQEPLVPLLADEEVIDESSEPTVVETRTRTDSQITDFNKRVKLNRRATDAYAQYNSFSGRYEFRPTQRARIDLELAEWKKKADANLCRLGTKWVPEREMLAAEDEALQLMRSASDCLSNRNFAECIKLLDRASDANPNGIRADFTLGLLYSLPFAGVKAPDQAERHFRAVLQRCPDHPAALNSLAITQIKLREYGAAAGTLTKAAALAANNREVAHNAGRFIMLAEAKRLPTPNDSVLRRFRSLYKELNEASNSSAFERGTGWLHMLPVFSAEESLDAPGSPPSEEQTTEADMVALSGGTGFVVAPCYVLTNRHVVDDDTFSLGVATEIRTIDPTDAARKRELRGKVVATSSDSDLALVQFEGLNAAPIQFASAPPELASDVLILGFPRTNVLGIGLKTTRGIVSGLPDETRPLAPDYVLFDAVVDHGNSGGPIVNRNACVVGVLTIGLAELSGGVTADAARAFVGEHVSSGNEQDQDPDSTEADPDWAAVARRLSSAVLQLTCYYDAGVPELAGASDRQRSDNAYEDQTCPWCSGLQRLPCPARGCVTGRVSVPYTVEQKVGDQIMSIKKTRKEPCRNCSGHGHVDCLGCNDGFDQELR